MCIEIENNSYSDSPSHVSHIKKKNRVYIDRTDSPPKEKIGCTLHVFASVIEYASQKG